MIRATEAGPSICLCGALPAKILSNQMRTSLKFFCTLIALTAMALLALYLSLPRISAQVVRSALEKQGLTDVHVEEESLGLRSATFRSIRFRKKLEDKAVEVFLQKVSASYSYDSLASRSISGLSSERADIRLQGFGALPLDALSFTHLQLIPGKDKVLLDCEWQPALPESLRARALSPAIQLKGHSLRMAELLLPDPLRAHLELTLNPAIELRGSLNGALVARAGDGAGWNFLEAKVSELAIQWQQSALRLETTLRANGELEAKASARYVPESGKGELRYRFSPLRFQKGPLDLATLFPGFPYPLELRSGELSLEGELQFENSARGPVFLQKSRLRVSDLAGAYNRTTEFSGLAGSCESRIRPGSLQLSCPAISMSQLSSGVPVSRIRLGLSLDHNEKSFTASGKDFHAELIGGELNARNFSFDLAREAKTLQPIEIEVKHLDLQELLKLKQNEQISATGVLDGKIPLTLEAAGFRVRDGSLAARGPGLLRYRPGGPGMGEANPALGLALQALENFQYSQLRSKLDYDPNGIMRFSIALQGRNPQFKSGQVFHFNINVEENILALIRSMTIADDFDRSIDRSVEEGQSKPPVKAKRKK